MLKRGDRVVLGVDLGKRQTPATIIALETTSTPPTWDPVRLGWTHAPGISSKGRTAVVHWVESIPLGTSYDAVAQRIWYVAEAVGASEIWMDGTGVGVAVEEMVRQRKPPSLKCALRAVTITSGQTVSHTTVPRRELLTRLAVELQEGRVKVAKGLSGWPELRKELLALDGEGRKKQGRDDLALGLALAVWGLTGIGPAAGERNEVRLV